MHGETTQIQITGFKPIAVREIPWSGKTKVIKTLDVLFQYAGKVFSTRLVISSWTGRRGDFNEQPPGNIEFFTKKSRYNNCGLVCGSPCNNAVLKELAHQLSYRKFGNLTDKIKPRYKLKIKTYDTRPLESR